MGQVIAEVRRQVFDRFLEQTHRYPIKSKMYSHTHTCYVKHTACFMMRTEMYHHLVFDTMPCVVGLGKTGT